MIHPTWSAALLLRLVVPLQMAFHHLVAVLHHAAHLSHHAIALHHAAHHSAHTSPCLRLLTLLGCGSLVLRIRDRKPKDQGGSDRNWEIPAHVTPLWRG
jgi:hypothetical protein